MKIETVILKNLIYNEEYSRRVLPFIIEDYFTENKEKITFSLISNFVNKFKTLPTYESLVLEVNDHKTISEIDHKNVLEFLKDIKNESKETVKVEWLIEHTEKFCQDKAIYNAIMESVSILDDSGKGNKNKGEIPKLLSDALAVSFDNNIGHDYISDYESRYDFYHKKETQVPFDLELMNKITKGGLPNKTLNICLAGTGVGKSLFMCHVAASCLSQGFNVLYITLEMAEERIAERIDANLLNVPLDDLSKMTKFEYDKRFKSLKNSVQGKLIIKEYPTASASSLHFRSLLNELQLKKNFKPHIIFIDYLNICTSSRIKHGSNVNSYSYIKSIAEELRGLAVEFDVPIVSATQTTRSGYCLDPDTLVESNTGVKKLSEVTVGDLVLSNNGWNKVLKVFPKVRKKMFKITTESGKQIIASEDHLFPTESGEKSIKKQLSLKDRLFIKYLG